MIRASSRLGRRRREPVGNAGELVKAFYGTDPLRASDASKELAERPGDKVIGELVPFDQRTPRMTEAWGAIVPRIRRLAGALGSPITGHLVEAISRGTEDTKWLAHHYFGGLEGTSEIQESLVEILADGAPNLDACRYAIEALGHLGMPADLVSGIANFAQTTRWEGGQLRRYAFEKLGPAAIRAIARAAAKASMPEDARWVLVELGDLVMLREREFRGHHPSAYGIVQGVAEDFSIDSLDPLMRVWGDGERPRFQQLAFDILAQMAPVRATGSLLAAIDKHDVSRPELAESAALALAEILDEGTAERVAAAYAQMGERRTLLRLPLVMLFPVLGDRGGTVVGLETVLERFPGAVSWFEYALALRGDHRLEKSTVEHLSAEFSEQRWMAALSLSRLLNEDARDQLKGGLDESGDDIERAAFCAALIRSGEPSLAGRFQSALQSALRKGKFRGLPTIWKLEILEAFRSLDGFRDDAFGLWCEAVGVAAVKHSCFERVIKGVKGVARQQGSQSDVVMPVRFSHRRREPGPRPHEYGETGQLVDRLCALAAGGAKAKPVMFLLGSALTMPDRAGEPGVPGVQAMVDLVRDQLRETAVAHELDELVEAAPPDVYQHAFRLLAHSRGPGQVNDVVRTAVRQAMAHGAWQSVQASGRQAEADFYGALERAPSKWKLPSAMDSFGSVLAKWRNTRGMVVLTTNFDPLIEVSLNKHEVKFLRTVMHGDGRPADPLDGETHVVHLHGYWFGADTLHRPDQLDRPRNALQNWLARKLESHVLVAIGYGGWEDVVTRTLKSVLRDMERDPDVLWAFYRDEILGIEESYETVLGVLEPGIQRGRVLLYRGVDCRRLFSAVEDRMR